MRKRTRKRTSKRMKKKKKRSRKCFHETRIECYKPIMICKDSKRVLVN
jgi:hypothetical protein